MLCDATRRDATLPTRRYATLRYLAAGGPRLRRAAEAERRGARAARLQSDAGRGVERDGGGVVEEEEEERSGCFAKALPMKKAVP